MQNNNVFDQGDSMNRTGKWEWHENDQPIDFSVFEAMTEKERREEIARLEAEARAERNRIDREKKLALV